MVGKLAVVACWHVRASATRWCRSTVPSANDRHQRAGAVRTQVPGGARGTTHAARQHAGRHSRRTITVEFDANARGPWDFKPAHALAAGAPGRTDHRDVRVPERAEPHAWRRRRSRATRRSRPAPHFNKLECFCFNQYTLEPGEKKQWPVAFVIDPKLSEGREDHHAVVHLLRSRRQGAAGAGRRGGRAEPGCGHERRSRAGSLLRTVKAVAWSFFGIRKRSDYEKDLAKLNPLHVIVGRRWWRVRCSWRR